MNWIEQGPPCRPHYVQLFLSITTLLGTLAPVPLLGPCQPIVVCSACNTHALPLPCWCEGMLAQVAGTLVHMPALRFDFHRCPEHNIPNDKANV